MFELSLPIHIVRKRSLVSVHQEMLSEILELQARSVKRHGFATRAKVCIGKSTTTVLKKSCQRKAHLRCMPKELSINRIAKTHQSSGEDNMLLKQHQVVLPSEILE